MHICVYGVVIVAVLLFCLLIFIVYWRRQRSQITTTNRSVLITGCDTGFGHHIAKQLCSRGFSVFAGCLNSNSDGAKTLSNFSKNIYVLQIDVTKDTEVSESLSYVENILGGKDLEVWAIINNAGISVGTAESEWCPLDQYERIMNVNLFGTIRVTKTFLPLIRKSQGRIINVASMAGRIGISGFSAYCATKFGLIGYSECLRKEMAKFNVKVVTIEPWMYKTAITQPSHTLEQNKKSWKNSHQTVKNAYGEDYFKAYQTLIQDNYSVDASEDISPVLDAIEDAVCSCHPRIAYIPELFHYIRTRLLLSLPYNIQEHIMTVFPKITRCRPKCIELNQTKLD